MKRQLWNRNILGVTVSDRKIAGRKVIGLTLIEMAVVMVVAGVMVGGGVIGVARYSYAIKAHATDDNFNTVLNALSTYAQHYDRLPCPADPAVNTGMERGWTAAKGAGNCINNTDLLTMYTQTEGVLPWKELGLPESAVKDGWGHYITYKPAPQLTVNNYSANMQDLANAFGALDVNNACRSAAWFDKKMNFIDRRKALFCCNAPPTSSYLTADAALATGSLPANWRSQAVMAAGTASHDSALSYVLSTVGLSANGGTTVSPGAAGSVSMPAATTVQNSGAWTDDPAAATLNGSFTLPNVGPGASDSPLIRANGEAVTLISHGGNGFLSFLRGKPASTLQQGSITTSGITANANMSVDEELNVWPPQLAAATVYNPKAAGGYDPMGLISGASDDRVVMLRADQLMGRTGGGCDRPANAGLPFVAPPCPLGSSDPLLAPTDPAFVNMLATDPACTAHWVSDPCPSPGYCPTQAGAYHCEDSMGPATGPVGPDPHTVNPKFCQSPPLMGTPSIPYPTVCGACAAPAPFSCLDCTRCGYAWLETPGTGACTTTCGSGSSADTYTCVTTAPVDPGCPASDAACLATTVAPIPANPKPVTSSSCTVCTACASTWTTGSWGACSSTCTPPDGTQTRTATCDNPAVCPCTTASPATSQACTDTSGCVPPGPTASLTANLSHNITVAVGTLINYVWSSTGGVSYSSSYTDDGSPGGSWVASDAGNTTSATVAAAQAGHTYVITYTVTDALSNSASDSVTIIVSGGATYSWVTGAWGSCNCLGGSKTRTVDCEDGGGTVVADANCTGAKPSTTGSCSCSCDTLCIQEGHLSSTGDCINLANPPCATGFTNAPLCGGSPPNNGCCCSGVAVPSCGDGTCNGTETCATCPGDCGACAVNGSCGSANGVAVSSAPTTNLCILGTASSVSGSGPWTWSCNGSGGGTNASCSAPLSSPVTVSCNASGMTETEVDYPNSYGGTGVGWTGIGNLGGGGSDTGTLYGSNHTVDISKYLDLTNFSCSIPAGATVTGVTVNITANQSAGTSALYMADASLLGVTGGYSENPTWPLGPSTVVSMGGACCNGGWGTFGATITPAQVNSSSFGVRIQMSCTDMPGNGVVFNINNFSLQVTYTP